ncbi:HlyD family efflux transporter periplasmic adaptor subunit [Candidatus Uabimicrobium sp. HlEnr_7]|uniref:HlyD family efflux transporter periplasmic adaptor subunit n=1 Tax=Candidatus Uabimicrobium helgolandensis TaxID=3095367 RepID=UPI0035569CC0
MKKWVIGLLIIIVGASAALYYKKEKVQQLLQTTVPKVKVKKISAKVNSVVCLGRLEPTNSLKIGTYAGSIIRKLNIKEGDYIKRGQIVAYLSTHKAKLQEQRYTESQIVENKRRLEAETNYAKSFIQEAKVRLETLRKTRAVELNAQQIQVSISKEDLAFATKEFDRLESMRGEGISEQQIEKQSYIVASKREALRYKQNKIEQIKINQQMSILMAEKQLDTAKKRLPQIQSSIPLHSLQQTLKLVKEQLQQTIVRSPVAGQVLKIFIREGENINGTPIMHIGNTKKMNVIAEVYQNDSHKIRVGQKVTISSSSIAKPLSGIVTEIGNLIYKNDVLGVDPSAKKDARVIEVKIAISDSQSVARFTNLQVTVKIKISEEQ